ncbi:MAG TPA: membrane dipeptidase [Longimicrobiales bacterium]|nr:membrane dipeptidase [Longimicrobiales bacterium]
MTTRRSFIKSAAAATLGAQLWPRVPVYADQRGEKTPFPYVDGLSFMGPPEDLAGSGLSAFITDVSSVEQIKTEDGAIKYFRSFDACARSITALRRQLNADQIKGAFLATKGSEIKAAYETNRIAVFFQFQGCEPIGEDLTRLDLFYELGLRVLQITHHNNNAWGGGAIEQTWVPLTRTGAAGIERLNELGIIPDLAHVSDPTSVDVLRLSKKPVIVSHGAARALVNNARCSPDEVIKGVADSGGAFGVFMMSFWLTTDATPSVGAYIRQIRHIVNIGGIEAAAIANDYPVGGEQSALKAGNDNAKIIANYYPWWDSVAKQRVLGFDRRPEHVVIPELNHVRRLYRIHDALARAGFKTGEIEKITGGNWVRVLTESLG